jgi:hypothetical protein
LASRSNRCAEDGHCLLANRRPSGLHSPNWQQNPVIVADGSGGAILAWEDNRSGNYDIYAQHVLASGEPDAAWPVDGLPVCTAANWQVD